MLARKQSLHLRYYNQTYCNFQLMYFYLEINYCDVTILIWHFTIDLETDTVGDKKSYIYHDHCVFFA
jgi:hypothetical protein